MFVYRKNTLEREIAPIDAFTAKYLLRHTPTGVTIDFKFITDTEKLKSLNTPESDALLNKRFSFTSSIDKKAQVKENILGPYKVYKLDANNNYIFVKDLYDSKKTLLDNFKDAIDYFEQSIFNELKETAPKPEAPAPKEENNAPKMSELPQVGDFVRVGADYGRVVDVDSITRMVKVEKMSQEDVKSLLKLQQQSQTETKEFGGLIDSIFKSGGEIVMSEGFFVVQVEPSGSNLKILRVQEPQSQEQGETKEEPQEPQETPDNVENPFQEQSQDEESEGGEEGEGGEGEDEEAEEGEGEEGEGEEGEGEEGEGQEGEGEEGEGEEGESDREREMEQRERQEDEQKKQNKGEKGEAKDGETSNEFDSLESDDDFGDDSDSEDPLAKIKKEIEKAQKDQANLQKQARDDAEAILNLFSMDVPTIKKNFISATTLKRAVGDTKIFEDDNNNRITRAIDLIFSL